MSYPVWPSDLPRPERSSYQLQPQDARRKRGFESGPPGYRRRFSAVAQMVIDAPGMGNKWLRSI